MRKRKLLSLSVSYILLILLAIVMIYPLIWMVGAAFKSNEEIFGTLGILPKNPVYGAF